MQFLLPKKFGVNVLWHYIAPEESESNPKSAHSEAIKVTTDTHIHSHNPKIGFFRAHSLKTHRKRSFGHFQNLDA